MKKGKQSTIRFKANRRKNKSIRPDHIETYLKNQEEKNRLPVLKRKNSKE